MTTLHPFGTTITDATLRQIFAPLNQWEDKYRQLILLQIRYSFLLSFNLIFAKDGIIPSRS